MGAQRVDRQSVHTCFESLPAEASSPAISLLLATQRDGHAGFGGSTAFVALHREAPDGVGDATLDDWTCDRRELFGIDGATVIPGLVDSHTHFIELGDKLESVDLTDVSTEAPGGATRNTCPTSITSGLAKLFQRTKSRQPWPWSSPIRVKVSPR